MDEGHIWVAGGNNDIRSSEIFDLSTKSWKMSVPVPNPGEASCAVKISDTRYFMTGYYEEAYLIDIEGNEGKYLQYVSLL